MDNHRQRFSELDALRGLAAFAVVIYHYAGHLHEFSSLPFRFTVGLYGVQLFFCISGFVIFWTLNRSASVMDFAVSRFSRLYPAYWASIGLWAIFVFFDSEIWLRCFVLNATMLQKFLGMKNLDVVYWTLAVELVFYFWMALAFAIGQLKHIVWIAAVWLSLSAAAALTHTHAFDTYLILPHIPYFVAGIAFYLIKKDGWRPSYVALLVAAFAVVCAHGDWSYSLAAAVVIGVFSLAITGRIGWLVNSVTTWLGAISYALYVTHRNLGIEVLDAFVRDRHLSPWLALGVALVFALVLATGVTYLVEQPAIRFIRRLYSRFKARGTAQVLNAN